MIPQAELFIDPRKGYVAVCPVCCDEFVSTEAIRVAEGEYVKHWIKTHEESD